MGHHHLPVRSPTTTFYFFNNAVFFYDVYIGTGLLIPRSPFTRVIKQISEELTGNSAFRYDSNPILQSLTAQQHIIHRPLIRLRFTSEALECLQVASEAMVIQLFEDSVWTMVNAKRLTLMVSSLFLFLIILINFSFLRVN